MKIAAAGQQSAEEAVQHCPGEPFTPRTLQVSVAPAGMPPSFATERPATSGKAVAERRECQLRGTGSSSGNLLARRDTSA